MEFHKKLKELKSEWQLFWSALFEAKSTTQKRPESFLTEERNESLAWLSQQRQRLNQRLESIKEQLDSSPNHPDRDHLHDEAQLVSEQISNISERISQAKSFTRNKQAEQQTV